MAQGTSPGDPGTDCPVCGTPVPGGYPFCGGCGHRLRAATTAAEDPAAPGGDLRPPTGRAPHRHRRRRTAAVVVAVAVALAGVAVLARSDPAPPPLTAAGRGDAAWTGTFAAPAGDDLAPLRWRDRWTQGAPRSLVGPVTPVAIEGGDVLVAVTDAVARLDGATGEPRWRVELAGASPPLPVDGRFTAVVGARDVTLLDVVDGTRLWSAPIPELGGRRAVAAAGRSLFVVAENGTVAVLDLARGERTATVHARDVLDGEGPFPSGPSAVAVGEHVAVTMGHRGDGTASVLLFDQRAELRWRSDVRVDPWIPLVAAGDVLLARDAEGVVALDLATGRARWRWRAAAGEDVAGLRAVAVTPDGERVLVVSRWPIRRVLDAGSGALVVSENADAPRSDLDLAAGRAERLALVTSSGDVEVIGVADGRTVATAPLSDGSFAVPAVAGDQLLLGLAQGVVASRPLGDAGAAWTSEVAPDATCPVVSGADTVLVGGDALRAQEADDGARRWTLDDVEVPLTGDVAAGDGAVVGVDVAGYAHAWDAVTGERRWRVPAGGQLLGPPVVAGGTVVLASGRDPGPGGGGGTGEVRALDPADGARRWTRRTEGHLSFPPSVAGDLVVVATGTGVLQGLDLATGEERWRHELDAPATTPPGLRGGTVVVTTPTAVVSLGIDGDLVTELARTRLGVPLRRSPGVTADTIVLRLDASTVVGLDLTDHGERWRAVLDDVATTAPTVAGELVVVGGQRGVHALDLADGRPRGLVPVGAVVGRIGVTRAGIVACKADGELVLHG